jgi:DedD protein
MREIVDDRDLSGPEPRKDAEFTLGVFALLAIVFGLILLCGVFFGLGYSIGKRGAAEPAITAQPATGPLIPSDTSHPKPSASAQPGGTVTGAGSANALADHAASSTSLQANEDRQRVPVTSVGAVPSSELSEGKPAVRPAVAEAAMTAGAPATNVARVAPALGSAAQLTVQVAAVSQQQDADVLASALRRRGYAATAHRDAADNLIHVRIGPFTTREDAEKWRQELLSDGYNAIIQP